MVKLRVVVAAAAQYPVRGAVVTAAGDVAEQVETMQFDFDY